MRVPVLLLGVALTGCATLQQLASNPYEDGVSREAVACFSAPGANPVECEKRYANVTVRGRVADISHILVPGANKDSATVAVDSGPARDPSDTYDLNGSLTCSLPVDAVASFEVNDRITLRGALHPNPLGNGYFLSPCALVSIEHPPFSSGPTSGAVSSR